MAIIMDVNEDYKVIEEFKCDPFSSFNESSLIDSFNLTPSKCNSPKDLCTNSKDVTSKSLKDYSTAREFDSSVKRTQSSDKGFEKIEEKPFKIEEAIKEIQDSHEDIIEIISTNLNTRINEINEAQIFDCEEILTKLNDEIEVFIKLQQLNEHRKKYQEDLYIVKCQYIEAEITAAVSLLRRCRWK